MENRRSPVWVAFCVVVTVTVMATSAGAQTAYTPPAKRVSPAMGFAQQKSSRPTPRTPDGHPDLSGVWTGGFPSPAGPAGIRRMGTFEPDQAVMQRGAGWNKPLYKPEFWEKVRSLDFSKVDVDPVYNCAAPGVPRQTAPAKIIQTATEVMLYNGETVRFVPIDGRERDPIDADYSFEAGVPLGHWEGDVLVVESVGFTDTTWLQWQGYFHTDKMKVIERFRRDGDLLFYQFTVEDPDVLMEPWTQDWYVRRLNPDPKVRILPPQPCEPTDPSLMLDPYERG